jgi:hypothetical protein
MDKITQILENVVRCKYFEVGVHIKNPIKNSYQDGLGRTTQTLDHVVVHIWIWDKRNSQINEYSDTSPGSLNKGAKKSAPPQTIQSSDLCVARKKHRTWVISKNQITAINRFYRSMSTAQYTFAYKSLRMSVYNIWIITMECHTNLTYISHHDQALPSLCIQALAKSIMCIEAAAAISRCSKTESDRAEEGR